MITKENLLVAKMADKKNTRPELQCIAFYGDRTIATDSYRMLDVPVKDGVKYDEPILMLADTVKIPAGMLGIEEPTGYRVAVKYPDVDKIMGDDKGGYREVKVNAKLFGELLTQMSKLTKRSVVTIRIPNKDNVAIKIEATCMHLLESDKRKAIGLLMPILK